MAEYEHVYHTFGPVYNRNSEILILGSLPSVKSREQGFYYGHPQNRFWKVLAAILDCRIPQTIDEKTEMLLKHHIALWDVIDNCDIKGSSDSSIRNVVPTDVPMLLRETRVQHIYVNGKTAGNYYRKLIGPVVAKEAVVLPSTSPANAAWSLERLTEAWRVIMDKKEKEYKKDCIFYQIVR